MAENATGVRGSKKTKEQQGRQSYKVINQRAKTKARLKTGLTNAKKVPRPKRSIVGKKKTCPSCVTCTSGDIDSDEEFSALDPSLVDPSDFGRPAKIHRKDVCGPGCATINRKQTHDGSGVSFLATSISEDSITLKSVHQNISNSSGVLGQAGIRFRPNNPKTKETTGKGLGLGHVKFIETSQVLGPMKTCDPSQTQVMMSSRPIKTCDPSQVMMSSRISPPVVRREEQQDPKCHSPLEESPHSALSTTWLADDVLENTRDNQPPNPPGSRKHPESPKQPSKRRYRLSTCQPTFPLFCANPQVHTPSAPPACWCTNLVQPQFVHPPAPHLPVQSVLPPLCQPQSVGVIGQQHGQANLQFLHDGFYDNTGFQSVGYNHHLFEFVETESPKPPPSQISSTVETPASKHQISLAEDRLGKCVVHGNQQSTASGLEWSPTESRGFNLMSSHELNFPFQGPPEASDNLPSPELSTISTVIAESDGAPFVQPMQQVCKVSQGLETSDVVPITFELSQGPSPMPDHEPAQEIVKGDSDQLTDPYLKTQGPSNTSSKRPLDEHTTFSDPTDFEKTDSLIKTSSLVTDVDLSNPGVRLSTGDDEAVQNVCSGLHILAQTIEREEVSPTTLARLSSRMENAHTPESLSTNANSGHV